MLNNKSVFFNNIQKIYEDLRGSEKKVADFIISQPEEVPHLTITELAKRSETSEATVNRLCKSLCISGYSQLKYIITRDLTLGSVTTIPQSIEKDDDYQTIVEKLYYFLSDVIGSTKDVVDINELEKAINAIGNANRIYIYGSGGNAGIALIAQNIFLRAGFINTACIDDYMQAVTASLLSEGDVVIGISHSGRTKDVSEALRIAKSHGATTIAICGNAETQFYKNADCKLLTITKEKPIYGDYMEAKISQMFIINLLNIGVLLKNYSKTTSSLEITTAAIWDRSIH